MESRSGCQGINGVAMSQILRTGKRVRPKTAAKGKRFHCARCHKRSPKPARRRTNGFKNGVRIFPEGISMFFVKCSVDGCNRKLQPILKVDPRDRDTWLYRECDLCLKPVCEKHSADVEGRIICD